MKRLFYLLALAFTMLTFTGEAKERLRIVGSLYDLIESNDSLTIVKAEKGYKIYRRLNTKDTNSIVEVKDTLVVIIIDSNKTLLKWSNADHLASLIITINNSVNSNQSTIIKSRAGFRITHYTWWKSWLPQEWQQDKYLFASKEGNTINISEVLSYGQNITSYKLIVTTVIWLMGLFLMIVGFRYKYEKLLLFNSKILSTSLCSLLYAAMCKSEIPETASMVIGNLVFCILGTALISCLLFFITPYNKNHNTEEDSQWNHLYLNIYYLSLILLIYMALIYPR